MSMCKATPALGKLFFISLFTWRKVISTRRVTWCCTRRNSPLVVALGQQKIHMNSDRHQAVHKGKIDPGVDELPRGRWITPGSSEQAKAGVHTVPDSETECC